MITDKTFLGLPEVAWVGIQAIAAILGLYGLLAYVAFTKRMTEAAEITRQAEVAPHLGMAEITRSQNPVPSHLRVFRVTNAGRGSSIYTRCWSTHLVPANYPKEPHYFSRAKAPHGSGLIGTLVPGKEHEVAFRFEGIHKARVYIVEGYDVEGYARQVQVLQRGNGKWRLENYYCKSSPGQKQSTSRARRYLRAVIRLWKMSATKLERDLRLMD